MKSVEALRQALRRQWDNPTHRESRLLGGDDAWPVRLSIGMPPPSVVQSDFNTLKRHIESWRLVTCGRVLWKSVRYRATAASVEVPTAWELHKPSDWITACSDKTVEREFDSLAILVDQTDPLFHSLFVRHRSLWRGRTLAEVVKAAELAVVLKPGCAEGRPLRTLALAGIDTKFFERNEPVVTALLDARYDGEVGTIGLEGFLNARPEKDHWLLVADLDGSLLPFRCQRVRSSELGESRLPGHWLLLIENERCLHQLPKIADTVAILGAGFDLTWVSNPTLREKRIGYWGDIDTWGLQFLAVARQLAGTLDALMMTKEVFANYSQFAVPESVTASAEPSEALTPGEKDLYRQLILSPRGRLEQEFLPESFVHENVRNWVRGSSKSANASDE